MIDISDEKIIDTRSVDNYEIWTDSGWEDIEAVHKTIPYDVWKLETDNYFLECADEHIVIGENGEEIYVYDLEVGDKIITETGVEIVRSVEKLELPPENMYDVSLKSDKHTYFSNGILSHNTTLTTVYALWNTCFLDDQRVMIVANKENTAINIFKKIRLAYELLPNYLKPGIKEWGKTGCVFANGSSIGISTTTSTAARGDTASILVIDEAAFIDCVNRNTKVDLRNKITGETKIVEIADLFFKTSVQMNADLIRYEENEEWEVLTHNGWSDFSGVAEYSRRKLIKVCFEGGNSIVVSPNHCFISKSGRKIFAKNAVNKYIKTKTGVTKVEYITKDSEDFVYDLVDVKKGNKYYTNDVLSHNTHLMEEFWKSVIPTVSSGKKTKIFMVSTPNGVFNKFYEIYSDAEKGKNDWKTERIDWWDVPGRNEKWKAGMISALGSEAAFEQEFGNKFLDSSDGAVGAEVIEEFKTNKKPTLWASSDSTYKVYEMPDKDRIYVIGVDVGEGIGRAASTAQVLDITDLTEIKQVAVYGTNVLEPYHFANRLVNLAASWGNPPLLIERNNCGAQILDALVHTHYYDKIVSYSKTSSTDGRKNTRHLGIFSHNNLRFNAVSNLRYWINFLHAVKINDDDTISEFETFVKYPNGTYRKKTDKHRDDFVMALVWALFVLETDVCQQYFTVDEFDDQNKPLKVSRTDMEYTDDTLYSLKDLTTGEIIVPSNYPKPNTPQKYQPIMGGNDLHTDDLDIDGLMELGFTIYQP